MIYKNKTATLAVVGAILVLVLGFATFSNTNTSVAFDGPPGSAGVGSGAFAVNATGSVAIATTTFSASKLRVAGSIQSTTGGFIFPDGSTQTTAAGSVTSTPAGYVTPGTFNSVAGTGGNYTFPASIVLDVTTSSSSGVIYKGSNRFIHDFAIPGTTGANTFVGINSGNFTMTGSVDAEGSSNTGIGYSALNGNTTGYQNTGVGLEALRDNTTGYGNTAIGLASMQRNTNGDANIALGMLSLAGPNTGDANIGIGYSSLDGNTSGSYNTAIGERSLASNLTGAYNIAIGPDAGYNSGVSLQTMTSSTFLGRNANSSANGITNSTAIGARAQVTKSNQVVIGNLGVTETLLNGSVGIGTTTAPVARLDLSMGSLAGNPLAFSMNDASSQWFFTIPRCTNCYAPMALTGDLVLRSANSNRFILTADNGTTASFAVTATNRVGVGTQAPSSTLHLVNSTATTSVMVGSKSTGVNRGRMCLWNGASYTLISFPANSITPAYATSTTC